MSLSELNASQPNAESLTKPEPSANGNTVTEISPSEMLKPEQAEAPVSFNLVASGKNLLILVLGGCAMVAVFMALSGDTCVLTIGCGHTAGGGTTHPIAVDFWGVAVALGFFAISGTLGLSAMPALAISMGLWALMKATFSI